jgi:hypothetical protein
MKARTQRPSSLFSKVNQVWWYTSVIPALGRLRQKDPKIEASLSYIARLCIKKPRPRDVAKW